MAFITCNGYNPCPVCGQKKDCKENTATGLVHCQDAAARGLDLCPPAGWNFIRNDRIGFAMFGPDNGLRPSMRERESEAVRRHNADLEAKRVERAERRKAAGLPPDEALPRLRFESVRDNVRTMTDDERHWLANRLCLPTRSFDLIGVQVVDDFMGKGPAYAFPERDAGGVCGYCMRIVEGWQKRHAGKRGLTVPDGWEQLVNGMLALPEGASDTLALAVMGIAAIGRPSNTGGVELLQSFLKCHGDKFTVDDMLIVLGENDKKADGKWPGKEGAERSAPELQASFPGKVYVAFPPNGTKDVRELIVSRRSGLINGETTLRQLGLDLADWLVSSAAPILDPRMDGPLAVVDETMSVHHAHEAPPSRLTDLPPAPIPSSCPHTRGVFMKHDETNRNRLCFFDCKALNCPHCGPLKRRQYQETVMEHLQTHAANGGEVFLYWCDRSRWENVRRVSSRAHGDYFRLELDNNPATPYLVVATTPPPAGQVPTEAVASPPIREAIDRLCAAIDALPLRPKVFVSTPGWKLLQEVKAKPSGWRRTGKFVASKQTCIGILDYHEIRYEVKLGNGRWWNWSAFEFASDKADHVQFNVEIGEATPVLAGDDFFAGAFADECKPPGEFMLEFSR